MADSPSAERLAWLDLEMTGLDCQRDVILQAALVVTEADLTEVAAVVLDIWQPARELERMTPFVRAMHEKTGLLARVAASQVDLREAERRLLSVLARHCSFPATLCGNSVGTDKRFVEQWMPGLAGFLHYRILDVSSLKLIAQRYYGASVRFAKSTEAEHDALFDIRNSIAEFAHYRKHLLRDPGQQ